MMHIRSNGTQKERELSGIYTWMEQSTRGTTTTKNKKKPTYKPNAHLEHLEEGRLSRVAPGGTGGHHNVDRRDGADTSGGGHAVVLDNITDFPEVAVGEDKANVANNTGEDLRSCGKPEGREGNQKPEIGLRLNISYRI